MSNKKTEIKPGKIWDIITKEYKFENLILIILAAIVLIFGALIIAGSLNVNPNFFVIGQYPLIFAWFMIVVALVSIVLTAWPFFKPSILEWKKVTKPTKKVMLDHSAKVFSFIIFLSFMFILFDYLISALFRLFNVV